jgi:hypothetical protein
MATTHRAQTAIVIRVGFPVRIGIEIAVTGLAFRYQLPLEPLYRHASGEQVHLGANIELARSEIESGYECPLDEPLA